jgi:hypothetical protein
MKRRINLFQKKERTDPLSIYATRIRGSITYAGVVIFILFNLVIFLLVGVRRKYDGLIAKKSQYLQYLLVEKEVEANMRYFKSKQTQLNTFLKDDAHFLPYYRILKESLDATSINTSLDIIEIDKNRNTRFVVKFANYDEMLLFLKRMESGDFLSHFNTLGLQSFSLNKQVSKKGSFQLELRGQFKELSKI